jgi:tetratricopeptide (TPR) repeat protein
MSEQLAHRAEFYFQQHKYLEAEKDYRALIQTEPDIAFFHTRLALSCWYNQKKEEAYQIAQNCISIDPTYDHAFYICAFLADQLHRERESLKFIETAISLNPEEAEYMGFKAGMLMDKFKWESALEEANRGLSFDPENLTCLNIRAKCLHKLDRKSEAHDTIREALQSDPNNAFTHANVGWTKLELGDHEQALFHFRQSLMLKPGYEHARMGLLETLKSKYLLYKIWLKYSFWVSNMPPNMRMGLVIGLVVLMRILSSIAKSNEVAEKFILPILIAYGIFAMSTWIITPLSNLMLRLNKFGRYVLNNEETTVANLVGVSLSIGLIGLIMLVGTDLPLALGLIIFGFLYMIPLSTWYYHGSVKTRKVLRICIVFLGLSGFSGALLMWNKTSGLSLLLSLFVVLTIIFQWVVVGLRSREN